MNCIEVKNITKNYGSTRALDAVSLRFEENKIYGLLGRNGAGKSTLLNIITGRVIADSGEVTVDGSPAIENDEALHKLYLANEKTLLPENMRVKDACKWTKEFYPDFDMDYALSIAQQFKLDISKRVKALSTGFDSIMKDIIALSVNAPYILLDEPVLGLDANNRDLFYRLLLEKYSIKPCAIIISTHLIEEVSNVIEDIVIIKESRIIKNESRESLLSKGYTVSGMAGRVEEYIKGKNVIGTESLGGLKTAYILSDETLIREDGLEFTALELQKLFIHLTNS
jgi:ABC-2 type transport system ATP-binding protein